LRLSYGTPALRLPLNLKELDFVQYFCMFTKNERQLKSISALWVSILGEKTSAIMPTAKDKNREKSMRCKGTSYAANPTLEEGLRPKV
jgi:hypothetical protein